MPPLFGTPVLAPSGDGRLELFVEGFDANLWHIWQTAWSNGWSGWASHGGFFGPDLFQPPADDDAGMQLEVSENSVGEAAVSGILCQREAELVRCGNHGKPFGLKVARELPICKPPGVDASLNQYSK